MSEEVSVSKVGDTNHAGVSPPVEDEQLLRRNALRKSVGRGIAESMYNTSTVLPVGSFDGVSMPACVAASGFLSIESYCSCRIV